MTNARTPDGVGNAKPGPVVVMAFYDTLPPVLRAAVRDAQLDWDVVAIWRAIEKGKEPVRVCHAGVVWMRFPPHSEHLNRRAASGTAIDPSSASTMTSARWRQAKHSTTSALTPFSRMLARSIGGPVGAWRIVKILRAGAGGSMPH